MYLFHTIITFAYMYGYMIFHLPTLRRCMRAQAAGDTETVRRIVEEHVPRWAGTMLRLAGAQITVTGRENIPAGRSCVFVANHRSYTDILVMLTCLDGPHGLLAKQEVDKLPLVRQWMRLLGCVFVQREDVRASMHALNDAAAQVAAGRSFTIFPEGTRGKGPEGHVNECKGGAFRIAAKCGAPLVPVVMTGTRGLFEDNGSRFGPSQVTVHILPPVETAGMSRAAQKALPEQMQALLADELARMLGRAPDKAADAAEQAPAGGEPCAAPQEEPAADTHAGQGPEGQAQA